MRTLIIGILLVTTTLALSQKPLVVASASMFADMAENIGGDLIDVKMIVPIGGDPHIYEPNPSDAQLVAKADLILLNGLTFEGWINELVANSGTKAKSVTLTHAVEAIESEKYQNATDPHAWMDADNGITYSKNIASALVRLMPRHSKTIKSNMEAYIAELRDLDSYIKEEIATIPVEQRILITSHDAFAYYGKKYGIRLEAIMGLSTDAEVQTSDLMRVSNIIRENNVKAIFVESTINPKLIKQIGEDNGAVIGGQLYADSLGPKTSKAGTYISMLKENTDVIVGALTGKSLSKTIIDTDKSESSKFLYIALGAILLGFLAFFFMKMNK